MEHYREFIDTSAKQIGLEQAVLHIDKTLPDTCSARPVNHGSTLKNVVQIDLTFLIKAKDIPKRFIIKSPDDRRIREEKFTREVIDWINAYFKNEQLSYPLKKIRKISLMLMLYRAKDPELLEKAREWEIMHELGHLRLNHVQTRASFHFENIFKMATLSVIASASIPSFIYMGINPFFSVINLPLLRYTWYASTRDEAELSREHEYQADAFSVKFLKDKTGAVHYFQTKLSFVNTLFPDKETEIVDPSNSHPPLKGRLKQVEKIAI